MTEYGAEMTKHIKLALVFIAGATISADSCEASNQYINLEDECLKISRYVEDHNLIANPNDINLVELPKIEPTKLSRTKKVKEIKQRIRIFD